MTDRAPAQPPSKPADGTLVRQVNLQALLRKRAAEQFASVRAGHGPIAVGAKATRPTGGDSAAATSLERPATTRTPTLKTKRSTMNLASASRPDGGAPEDNETSARAPGRTLKAKPSVSALRATETVADSLQSGPQLAPRSTNLQSHGHASSMGPKSGNNGRAAATSATQATSAIGRTTRQNTIAASPVMSAMLKSRIPVSPQRRIKEVAEPVTPGSRAPASAGGGVGFSGGGIRVKAVGASVSAVNTPIIKAAGRTIRANNTPGNGTTLRTTVGRSAQSPFATPRSAATASLERVDTNGLRPVTVKTGYSGYR